MQELWVMFRADFDGAGRVWRKKWYDAQMDK